MYAQAENHDPNAIWAADASRIVRNGNVVDVRMYAIRSYFSPSTIEVNQGDSVVVHITNAEQSTDMLHGWGLDVGETNFVAISGNMWQPGIYFFSDN